MVKESEKHKMLIDLPKDVIERLCVYAGKEGRKLKPYVERIIIKHAERKKQIT